MQALRLPCRAAADPERLLDAVRYDKKRDGGNVRFVLLAGIGRTVVEDIPLAELAEAIEAFPDIIEPTRTGATP
jgi:3-dehydroquinate synthase